MIATETRPEKVARLKEDVKRAEDQLWDRWCPNFQKSVLRAEIAAKKRRIAELELIH